MFFKKESAMVLRNNDEVIESVLDFAKKIKDFRTQYPRAYEVLRYRFFPDYNHQKCSLSDAVFLEKLRVSMLEDDDLKGNRNIG